MAPFLRRAAVAAPMRMNGRLVRPRAPLHWRQHACSRQCVAALQLGGGGAAFSTDAATKKSDPLESLPAVVRENCVGMGQVRAAVAQQVPYLLRLHPPAHRIAECESGRRWYSATASTQAR